MGKKVLSDKYELVQVDGENEQPIFSNADKGKVVRMKEYWIKYRPNSRFRIDRLVRTREEGG